jgi:mono/diheme cytochrome c family protein
MTRFPLCSSLAAAAALLCAAAPAQPPAGNAALVGDAARGRPLYADTFNCYACHGFDGQTGERRLVPMNYTQEGFIALVQNSPLPNMPAFPDAPTQALADIYAYIKTIPADAPAVGDVPLLREILERKTRTAAE